MAGQCTASPVSTAWVRTNSPRSRWRKRKVSEKIKNVKLSWPHEPMNVPPRCTEKQYNDAARYRVEQITDSTEFNPGDLLDKVRVNSLCHSMRWKVIIVPVSK